MDQLSDVELWDCLPKRLRPGLSAAGSRALPPCETLANMFVDRDDTVVFFKGDILAVDVERIELLQPPAPGKCGPPPACRNTEPTFFRSSSVFTSYPNPNSARFEPSSVLRPTKAWLSKVSGAVRQRTAPSTRIAGPAPTFLVGYVGGDRRPAP